MQYERQRSYLNFQKPTILWWLSIFEYNHEKLRNLGSRTYKFADSLVLARRAAEEGEMEESASHHLFDAPGVSRGPQNIRNRSCENVPGSPGNIENTQLLELRAIHVWGYLGAWMTSDQPYYHNWILKNLRFRDDCLFSNIIMKTSKSMIQNI